MNAPPLTNQSISTSGAVMVIGGSVAGVQAAFDLSEPGFKVCPEPESVSVHLRCRWK